jgi:hypothetical protein
MPSGQAREPQTNIHQRPPVEDRQREQIRQQTGQRYANRIRDLHTKEEKGRNQKVNRYINRKDKKPQPDKETRRRITKRDSRISGHWLGRGHRSKTIFQS